MQAYLKVNVEILEEIAKELMALKRAVGYSKQHCRNIENLMQKIQLLKTENEKNNFGEGVK